MSPLEAMAKAIAKEDWGAGRAGGEWSEELWERLATTYRKMQTENPDIIDAHYLWTIYRKARAALLALAEADLTPEILNWVFAEEGRAEQFLDDFRAICRSIAEEGK